MALPENCIITINGRVESGNPQVNEDSCDTIELITRGYFTRKGENFFITYHESEATGYKGCTTTVKIAGDSRCVTMLRFGPAPSQLVIEKGTRHICHYETGVGAMTLGVAADEIEHNLTDEGGEASFSYTLDTDAQLLSRNCVRLRVRLADSCRS